MHFLFLPKVPVNKPPPPCSPAWPLWRELPLQGLLYISLKLLTKISLNRKLFPSVKSPRKGASFHVLLKRGPYGKRRPYPEPYLANTSGSPVKEPSLFVPFTEPLRERCSTPRALFHSSYEVPNIQAPFQVSPLTELQTLILLAKISLFFLTLCFLYISLTSIINFNFL